MSLQSLIEEAFEARLNYSPKHHPPEVLSAVQQVLAGLDEGSLRVAKQHAGVWQTQQWLKKAVLLSFRLMENKISHAGDAGQFFDKLPTKFQHWQSEDFQAAALRAVPGAWARYGAYIGPQVILMPSYVNVGAYVGQGTMVDTWATVGSCAQIGQNVHLSGGVGIGGVLEPLQANPTIIEDDVFIGARSEVVEGVIVERGSVLSMGVYLSQSTKIYHRASGEILYGRVPAGSVVVPGSLPAADGSHHLACAVIVKTVDAQTRAKTSINELLRDL